MIRRLALLVPCVAVAACGGSADDDQRVALDPASNGVQPAALATAGPGPGDPTPTNPCLVSPIFPGAGSVDTSFGCAGYAKYSIDGVDVTVRGLAVQPDDKIVAVGMTYNPSMNHHDVWAARFTSSGALDTTFATGGVYTKSFVPFGGPSSAETVAIQSSGAIVMAGGYFSEDQAGAARTGFVLRLLPNGTLDPTFATGGILTTTSFTYGRSLKIQSNGSLVLAADRCTTSSTNCVGIVARFDGTTGAGSSGFGMMGYLSHNFNGESPASARGAAVSGNNVVVVGRTKAGSGTDAGLARFNLNGVDIAYGTSGYIRHDTLQNETAYDIANVGTGHISVVSGTETPPSSDYFMFLRTQANGNIDSSFGFVGRVNVSFQGYGAFGSALVYTGGKIVGVGSANTSAGKSRLAVTRINTNGGLDTTFSSDGYTMLAAGGDEAAATSVVVQSTGRIIAGGWTRPAGGTNRAVLVRIRN